MASFQNAPITLKLAVVLHLFYEDQWPEFLVALTHIPQSFTLFVSLQPESAFADQIRNAFPTAVIKTHPNVGRDVASFLAWLPELQCYDLVCKVHTKRSDGRHSAWRKNVVAGLLGNRKTVEDYLCAFARHPDLGLAGPRFCYVDGAGHQAGLARALTLQHGAAPKGWGFFAGTMFWCRPQVFAGLDAAYPADCFVVHNDTDGQPEHVAERAFGLIVMQAHQKIMLHDAEIIINFPENLRGDPNWGDVYNTFQNVDPSPIAGEPVSALIKDDIHLRTDPKHPLNDDLGDAPIHARNIETLMAKGQVFAALALALQPAAETQQNLTTIARIESYLGLLGRAKRTWLRVLQMSPNASAYAGLGAVLVQNGDTDAGIESFHAGLEYEPQNTAILSSLAVAHLYLNDVITAQHYAAQALKIDPKHPDAMLCRARAEFALGNIPMAKTYVDDLMQTGFKTHEVLLVQIDILSLEGEHEAALVLAADLCQTYPTASECLAAFRRAFRAFHNSPTRYMAFLAALDIPWTPATVLARQGSTDHDSIDVIIPIHNALDQVRACLQTVKAHSGTRLGKLILVNDGSAPETVAALSDCISANVILVHTAHRSGFTTAVLRGLSASDAPAFVVLNSDTLVTRGWLDRLSCALRSTAKTAMVSAMSNNAAWQNYGPAFDATNSLNNAPIPDPFDRDRLQLSADNMGKGTLVPLPMLHGFCVLLDRAAYDAVGGFDMGTYPEGYGETQDLSLRFLRAGYDLRLATDCIIYHARGGSISQKRRENLTNSARQTLYETYTALNYLCLEMACYLDPLLQETRLAYARMVPNVARPPD